MSGMNSGARMCLSICLLVFLQCSDPSRKNAGGDTDDIIEILKGQDDSLSTPQPGDWLYSNDEPGQSFQAYVNSRPVKVNEQQNKIYLQPWGEFSRPEMELIQATAEYLTIFFELQVVILPTLVTTGIPENARRTFEPGHDQILTGYILNKLVAAIPADAVVIMAITSDDLYPSDDYNFVFGQASLKKRVGVSSIYRLEPDKPVLCLERLIKTSSHEIGHMFSCQHCTHAVCVMNGSNSLWESDSRPNRLCYECHRKLHWNIGFDARKRLLSLRDFFARHKLVADQKRLQKDIDITGIQ